MNVSGRVVGFVAVAAMVAGSGVAAHAGDMSKPKLKVRKVTISYTGACGVDATAVSGTAGVCPPGASDYALAHKAGEKYLTILVKDSATSAVSGNLWLSSGAMATAERFCGSLKNYAMGQPTYSMNLNDAANPSCPGAATTGTITVEYSNLPLK